MEQERKGGGGTGLEPGLLGSLSLHTNSCPLGWGWDLSGANLVNNHPSSSANLSEANRVFKASPRAWQVKSSSVPTPPPIQMGSLVTQEVSSEHPRAPWAPLVGVGAQVDTQWLGWSLSKTATTPDAPPSLPSGAWGPCCVQCLSLPNHLVPQAPTQDSLVSLSSRINSSPNSSENLSEIPLSHKGVPPSCPVA